MPYIIPEAARKAAWDAYFKQNWEQGYFEIRFLREYVSCPVR